MQNEATIAFDSQLTEQHFSTRIYGGFLKYLEQTLGMERARTLIEKTGLTWDYLTAESNWVSEKFAERFFEVMTDDPSIPSDFSYQAGKTALSQTLQSSVQVLAVQMFNPALVYDKLLYFARQYNKVDSLKILSMQRGSMRLEFISHRETKYLQLIEDNWRGFLEQIPTVLGLPPARIRVVEKGDRRFVFDMAWESNRTFLNLKRAQFALVTSAIVCAVVLVFRKLGSGNVGQIPALLLMFISSSLGTFVWIERLRQRLHGRGENTLTKLLQETEERYGELLKSKSALDRRYREAKLMTAIVSRLSSSEDSRSLIAQSVRELQDSLKYDRVIYMSYDPTAQSLSVTAAQGFEAPAKGGFVGYKVDVSKPTPHPWHLGNVFREGKPVLVPVTDEYFETLSEEGRTLLYLTKSRSFILCPVVTDRDKFGILLADYTHSARVLDEEDLKTVTNVANQLAIGLSKAVAFEKERRIRMEFQRFVPPQVMESLIGERTIDLESGIHQEVSILFSDIRQFTKRSSTMEPSLLIKALNYYFKAATDVVYRNGGIVDKFTGDGLLAIFNAFGNDPNHSSQAVQAALKMQAGLDLVNREIHNRFFSTSTWEPFDVGIGIHTGVVAIGNLGTANKTEFTAIGETVNVASRLMEISKQYPKSILVSKAVAAKVSKQYNLQPIGAYPIRGLDREMELLIVVDRKPA